MSVSLLTSGQAQLSPFTSFTTLRGNTISLDSLTVNTITAGKLLIGDDAIPDVYYFGQIPGTSIFGFARNGGFAGGQAGQGVLLDGSPGSSAYARENGATPFNYNFPANTQGFSANTVTTTPDVPNTGMAQALIAFPEPIHYTATSGGDPLNPYIHASIMSAGLQLPNNVGTAGTPIYPSVPGTACVRPGIQALNPIIVVKQDANLLSASGAWFGLPLPTTRGDVGSSPTNAATGITPAAAANPNQFKAYTTYPLDASIYSNIRDMFCRQPPESANYLSPLQMSFFVAGCPPSTPPSAWAPPTSTLVDPSVFTFTAYPGFTGYGAGSPIQCHKFNLVFPSGITGSGITFPAASQGTSAVTTLVNANPALYPDVVYPINANTSSPALLRLAQNPNVDANGILALPPYTNTGGIWIQQIWWVQTTFANGVTPGVFNITHLFTKAGGGGTSPVNACRLEVSGRRTAGGAASDDPNGAFTVSVYLPRTLSTTGRPAYASQAAVFQTGSTSTARQLLPVDSTFPTTRSFGYFVVFLCCSSPTSGVNGGGLEQAPSPTACRLSDNTVPPAGQAGTATVPYQTNTTQRLPTQAETAGAAVLGQFSQFPLGFTDNQTAQLSVGAANAVRPYFWTSTPVAPVAPAPWYSGAPMLEGQFILTGNV